MPAPIIDFRHIDKVLVVKPSSLGDIVHTLPSVHLIKKTWPHLQISWLVNAEFSALLEGNPDLADVVTFPRQLFRGLQGRMRFFSWLKEFRLRPAPDAALDFQGLFRSGFIARSSRAPFIVGLSDSREGSRFFHHLRVPVEPEAHAVERYLSIARAFGAEGEVAFPLPLGQAPDVADCDFENDYIVLHPFSRGEGKSLTHSQVANFCLRMAPLTVYIVGRYEAAHLLTLPENTTNLLNQTTLPELAWLMRRAAYIVSVDSGPMHIAAAITGRLLGLHTWSDPRRVGPWHPDAWVWKAGHLLPCRNLDPVICTTSRAFEDSDIPVLAEFVREQINASAP